MRHCVSRNLAAHAVEAQIGSVVLPATIEAAADLDVQILDCFILLKTFLTDPLAQLCRQPARGRNSQFASVRSWTTCNVHQRPSAGVAQADGVQCAEELAHITLADPADYKILLDRSPHRFLGKAADDVSERTQLVGGNVAERKCDHDRHVSWLLLWPSIKLQPTLEVI